ncbi:MAG: bifunctional DedA family/phosphatase PAP2 family protein [Patescibacteria group bacterium]|nr:bifunctional DedA family/phosphatase PAP2 family protein [Patescibacteria group bacterium]MDE2172936.1 bifunctional DedA family/phosphatase PAP2 family protein [Patescibacteria group bacterium]
MPYAHEFSMLATHLQAIIGQGGYVILFICTLLEGIPVIGMAVPGHVAIIIAGFLARIGTLDLRFVMATSIAGAVLGDYLGFLIGRHYGVAFIERLRPYFFVTNAHIEKARQLLARHTGKAMVLGRFMPATRALMPFIVGTSSTSAARFWFFNVIGGISWTVASVLLGYIFGSEYHVAAGLFGRGVVGAIIVITIGIWGYRFVNMHYHIFRRYELFTLALNATSLIFLALMVQDAAAARPFMVNTDVWINSYMNLHNHGTALYHFWATLALFLSTVGGTVVTIGLGISSAVYLACLRRWRSTAIMLLSIGSTGLLLGVLKEFFMRARPANALMAMLNDPSFPSGHAGMAAAFFVSLAYLVAPKIGSWIRRELFIVACVAAVFLIGLSRLVLNVHWTSDVIAGWSLGTFLATASILIVKYAGNLFIRKVVNTE